MCGEISYVCAGAWTNRLFLTVGAALRSLEALSMMAAHHSARSVKSKDKNGRAWPFKEFRRSKDPSTTTGTWSYCCLQFILTPETWHLNSFPCMYILVSLSPFLSALYPCSLMGELERYIEFLLTNQLGSLESDKSSSLLQSPQ